MATEREKFPAHFTFSQRYGYEPLPEPMRLEYLSKDLRRDVWDEIHEFFHGIAHEDSYGQVEFHVKGKYIIRYILAGIQEHPRTEVKTDFYETRDIFRSVLMEGRFNKILDYLEMIFNKCLDFGNDNDTTNKVLSLAERVAELFEKHAAAYWLDTSQRPYWFFPRASKEQGDAIQQAIQAIRHGGMNGAATHLQKAGQRINEREYADSIRESIHAVESVARKIDPAPSKNLGPALKSLERAGLLKHKALREGFNSIYGYTNDEEGIRHPLVDQSSADVGLDEAIFMFGACASFAAYLTQKRQHLTPKCLPEVQDQQRRQDDP